MASRLTARRLEAIVEALIFRTAGEIECDEEGGPPPRKDYDDALDWALGQLEKRKSVSLGGTDRR
jgi:hypothetical protein